MAKSYVIGTDVGTSGTKTVLVRLDGKVMAHSLSEYTVDTPRQLWAEQWPQVWLDAVKSTIRAVMESSRVDPAEVAGLCISSLYGGSGVPCDERMEAVRPCLIWMDRRAADEGEQALAAVGPEKLFAVTGNTADPYFGFTKMLWIRRNEPEHWRRIKRFVPPNAYIVYHLTGEMAIDYTSAGNIGGIFDMNRRKWSSELMETLGISPDLMPQKLVDPSDVVGLLTRQVAEQLGLKAGTPVCAGAVDCLAANLSAGVTDSGQHVAVVGTSLNWGVVHEGPAPNPALVSMPYLLDAGRKLYTYGGASTAGALPRWFRDVFTEEKSAIGYRELDKMAEPVGPGSEGLLALPYFMGERTPIWDADAKGTIVGLTLHHRREHIYRSLLEAVAYSLRHIMETFPGASEQAGECIVVGGAAKSALWKQIFADVLGMSVVSPAGNVEAPLGDAFLAALGTGTLRDPGAIRQWVSMEPPVRPDRSRSRLYSQYYELYRQLYPKLADTMKELSRLGKR